VAAAPTSLVVAWLALVGCTSPLPRGDRRADALALAAAIAADDRTMAAADGPLGRLGSGHESAAIAARLEGDLASSARTALRVGRAAKVGTARGRALKPKVVAALEERVRVLRLYRDAARSGRPEDLLAAIRAARALEEDLSDLDERVDALGR
jgi:hypothetical protein